LQRLARRPGAEAGESLPITEAGPGFLAEGASVTTSTTYLFPEGEKQLKGPLPGQFGQQQTGTIVRAKLFAPKGRTFHSVSGMRVLKAVDDKGREIAGAQSESEGQEDPEQVMSFAGNRARNDSAIVDLRLQLPAADAASITELSGEAVAVTIGKWKEFTITNLQAEATNEVDVSSLLPGARAALVKVTTRNRQTQVQLRLKGGKEIRQLDVQLKQSGGGQFNSYAQRPELFQQGHGEHAHVNVQAYSPGEERGAGPFVLVLRSPEDMKRERVKFALKDLDLF
jgi:hypothetical protein